MKPGLFAVVLGVLLLGYVVGRLSAPRYEFLPAGSSVLVNRCDRWTGQVDMVRPSH